MTVIIDGKPHECDQLVINQDGNMYMIQPLPEKIAIHKLKKKNNTVAYLEISPVAPGIVTLK